MQSYRTERGFYLNEHENEKSTPHPRTPMQPSLRKSNHARGAQAGSLPHGTSKTISRRYVREAMHRLRCDPSLSFAEYTEAEEALALREGKALRTEARLARASLDRVATEADFHALALMWNER